MARYFFIWGRNAPRFRSFAFKIKIKNETQLIQEKNLDNIACMMRNTPMITSLTQDIKLYQDIQDMLPDLLHCLN